MWAGAGREQTYAFEIGERADGQAGLGEDGHPLRRAPGSGLLTAADLTYAKSRRLQAVLSGLDEHLDVCCQRKQFV